MNTHTTEYSTAMGTNDPQPLAVIWMNLTAEEYIFIILFMLSSKTGRTNACI